MPNDVHARYHDRQISHRKPGPFKVEKFKSGFAVVTNAQGINWISGFDGQTWFRPEMAEEIASQLNAVAGEGG
jgi:hypothetical protein